MAASAPRPPRNWSSTVAARRSRRLKFPEENLEQAVKKIQTLRCHLVGIVSLLATGASAKESPAAAPGNNQVEPAQSAVAREGPRIGDFLDYSTKEENSGVLTDERTHHPPRVTTERDRRKLLQ